MRIPDNPIEKFLFFAVFSVFGYSCAKATLGVSVIVNSSFPLETTIQLANILVRTPHDGVTNPWEEHCR